MLVHMPPHSMLCCYEASDLTVDEAQELVAMLARMPRLLVWRGRDNTFSEQRWHEQFTADMLTTGTATMLSPQAYAKPLKGYPGIYVTQVWFVRHDEHDDVTKDADTGAGIPVCPRSQVREDMVNLEDLLYLNSALPCTVMRNSTVRMWESDWIWRTGGRTPTKALSLRGDAIVQLQKLQLPVDALEQEESSSESISARSTVLLLSKSCTLRMLLQWQVDAKKSVSEKLNESKGGGELRDATQVATT